jgi:hypothetical protein
MVGDMSRSRSASHCSIMRHDIGAWGSFLHPPGGAENKSKSRIFSDNIINEIDEVEIHKINLISVQVIKVHYVVHYKGASNEKMKIKIKMRTYSTT